MFRAFTVFIALILFTLLDSGYGHKTRVLKCPCTFSVSREAVPSANNQKFDVLVQPFASIPGTPYSKGTNVIEKFSSRNLKISDAVKTNSGYHFFHKMHITSKGLFRIRIRHQSNSADESEPDYNLDLHTTARQVICPVVLAPDQPLLELPSSRAVTGNQSLQVEIRPERSENPRIVGGLFISPNLLPFLVAIQIPAPCSDGSTGCANLCTGTILSSKWVMTAAHCGVTEGSAVLVGTRSNRIGRFTSVARVIPHPEFANNTGLESYFFDIAVVELEENIEDCCTPSPQFMPINFNTRFPRQQAFVRTAGYGVTSEDPNVVEPVPGLLRQVDVPVVRFSDCEEAYGVISADMQVCAGYFSDGECDSCFGDSGGPLVQYAGGTPVLMGITSFGIGCARAGLPGVYTRPAGHREWLESTPAVFTAHSGRVSQVRRRCKRGEFLPYIEGEVSECTACPEDQYSNGGPVRACQQCPGNLLRDTRRGSRCSCRAIEGFGIVEGEDRCEECQPGSASRNGGARCLRCKRDTFAPDPGMSECLECPGARRGATECSSS